MGFDLTGEPAVTCRRGAVIRRMNLLSAAAATFTLGAVALTTVGLGGATAMATPIYSQGSANAGTGIPSDRTALLNGQQQADDFILPSSGTARSVTWRGLYASGTVNNTPPNVPLSFELIFYASNGSGLPDRSNVVSTSPATFADLGTITDIGNFGLGIRMYEFRANLNPTALSAGTRYWFSPLGNTSNDSSNDFYWLTDDTGGTSATRVNVSSNPAFSAASRGPYYFILDDAFVPEPVALTALMGALALLQRRRAAGAATAG